MEFFEMTADTFTDADELMNFAATWGIQDSPGCNFDFFSKETRNTVATLLTNNWMIYFKMLKNQQTKTQTTLITLQNKK
jgi:hypothetical protein